MRGNQHLRDDVTTISEPPDSWQDVFADDIPGTQYKLYDTPARGAKTQASYRLYLPPGYNLPENKDLILFYEYFHGDNASGLGASHQTGWSSLVTELISNHLP